MNMQMSCMTSVYATEYNPPINVYSIAMAADMMTAQIWFNPTTTLKLAPVRNNDKY